MLAVVVFGLISCVAHGFQVPCTQKLIGSKCLFDEECYGPNTVCRDYRCTCPTNFEEVDLDARTVVCRPAPNQVGAACQRDCKPPLLCRDGKCECWGGNVVGGVCTVSCPAGQQLYGVECMTVAHLDGACRKNEECIDPFNDCINQRCACTPGTRRDRNGRCFATCPNGQGPSQSCRRLFINDIDMLDNADLTDSCPVGQRCVGYGSPYIGHCCKMDCPFGEADTSQSCDVGAPEDQQCRPLTHYCHSITEPGWKGSICCPRPCRDPTPLYLNGRCVAIAHRGDPCQLNQQCEGGVTMKCESSVCVCSDGFKEQNDDRFPTCGKSCQLDEVPVANMCLARAKLKERCLRTKQCPNFAECRFGICQCLCGYKEDSFLGDRCTNPDDPLSLNTILSGVERIFGNKGKGEGRIGRL
uniref:EB domain-containing protein n=1 Tax=Plectus sambesii TaxID=2011161 RepID=A0A914XAZ7_9BILA